MSSNNFSDNLRILRINKKLNQTQIAEHLNVTRGAYCNYELGNREPSFDFLIQLSNFFNVSIDRIIFSDMALEINAFSKEKNILPFYALDLEKGSIDTILNDLENTKQYYISQRESLTEVLETKIPTKLKEIDFLISSLKKLKPTNLIEN